ncbi:hypothetical protein HYC85_011307 [Camellia sinensis]|uniref:RING-type domain-containing protein n=1 Tax=Camellia sinensis TaxID=4442 RepID=A0A7J7HBQ8_CAMSI|nr:hypothetical protein HYC85_011307 [Camellia sinensis]
MCADLTILFCHFADVKETISLQWLWYMQIRINVEGQFPIRARIIGGRENFFHCNKCRCCYLVLLKNSHPCVEGAMHNDCPVCFEYLFESRNYVIVMPCGHTIHESCLKDMHEHYRRRFANVNLVLQVRILCNDCGTKSEVQFHIVAQKCPNCKSYNTRQIRGI